MAMWLWKQILEWWDHKPRNPGSYQKLEEVRYTLSWSFQRKHSLDLALVTLVSDFCLQNSDRINYPKFVIVCYNSHRKLIQLVKIVILTHKVRINLVALRPPFCQLQRKSALSFSQLSQLPQKMKPGYSRNLCTFFYILVINIIRQYSLPSLSMEGKS